MKHKHSIISIIFFIIFSILLWYIYNIHVNNNKINTINNISKYQYGLLNNILLSNKNSIIDSLKIYKFHNNCFWIIKNNILTYTTCDNNINIDNVLSHLKDNTYIIETQTDLYIFNWIVDVDFILGSTIHLNTHNFIESNILYFIIILQALLFIILFIYNIEKISISDIIHNLKLEYIKENKKIQTLNNDVLTLNNKLSFLSNIITELYNTLPINVFMQKSDNSIIPYYTPTINKKLYECVKIHDFTTSFISCGNDTYRLYTINYNMDDIIKLIIVYDVSYENDISLLLENIIHLFDINTLFYLEWDTDFNLTYVPKKCRNIVNIKNIIHEDDICNFESAILSDILGFIQLRLNFDGIYYWFYCLLSFDKGIFINITDLKNKEYSKIYYNTDLLTENHLIGYVSVNTVTDKIIYCNRFFSNLIKYPHSTTINTIKFNKLVVNETVLHKLYAMTLSNKQYEMHRVVFKTSEGNDVWCNIFAGVTDTENVIECIILDVTFALNLVKESTKKTKFLRELLNESPYLSIGTDCNNKIIFVTNEIKTYFNMTVQDLLDMDITTIFPERSHEKLEVFLNNDYTKTHYMTEIITINNKVITLQTKVTYITLPDSGNGYFFTSISQDMLDNFDMRGKYV